MVTRVGLLPGSLSDGPPDLVTVVLRQGPPKVRTAA